MITTYFYKHTTELQKYIYLSSYFFIVTFFINYLFCDQWIYLLLKPLFKLTTYDYFIVTEITEIFFIKILLSFLISCFFSIIYIFTQIWIFFSIGLFKIENYFLIKWFTLFIINLMISVYISIKYIIPMIGVFFISFLNNPNDYLYNYFFEPKLSTYLYFILKISIGISIICQYPLLIIFCVSNDFLKINTLINFRKLSYLLIYISISLISPPNVEIQFALTIGLVLIFELIIFIFILRNKSYGRT